ncbi:MAG TPA: hypothetical protein VGV59_03375 [Pyrinomonadaceae bacterium]|nr:hypothetical protein [Pyrinomonadaceae bacterium]
MKDKAPLEPQLQVVADRRPASAPKYFRIRDFNQFQHYKDRNPRWVKLHGEQLEDYEFQQLPDSSKFHALALTYLASRTQNKIPNDPGWVAAKIGATDPVNLTLLWEFGFLEPWQPKASEGRHGEQQLPLPEQDTAAVNPAPPAASDDASKVLAERYQDASTLLAQNRTEQSRAETHTETDTAPASAGRVCQCCGVSVCSEFSYENAFRLVQGWKAEGRLIGGRPIENPGGLARKLHQEGTADAEIRLLLRPPPRREFLDEPCRSCLGTKFQTVPGKGAQKCPDCIDEKGVRTGKRARDADAQPP